MSRAIVEAHLRVMGYYPCSASYWGDRTTSYGWAHAIKGIAWMYNADISNIWGMQVHNVTEIDACQLSDDAFEQLLPALPYEVREGIVWLRLKER